MRALLYKDLVVNRSTILSYLVLAVVVLLLPYVGGHWVFPLAITLVFPVAYCIERLFVRIKKRF